MMQRATADPTYIDTLKMITYIIFTPAFDSMFFLVPCESPSSSVRVFLLGLETSLIFAWLRDPEIGTWSWDASVIRRAKSMHRSRFLQPPFPPLDSLAVAADALILNWTRRTRWCSSFSALPLPPQRRMLTLRFFHLSAHGPYRTLGRPLLSLFSRTAIRLSQVP